MGGCGVFGRCGRTLLVASARRTAARSDGANAHGSRGGQRALHEVTARESALDLTFSFICIPPYRIPFIVYSVDQWSKVYDVDMMGTRGFLV